MPNHLDYTEDELQQLRHRAAIAQAYQDAILRKSASRTIRQRQLLTSIGRIYNDPKFVEFSDMAVDCRGKIFKVHKAIVCAQSGTIRDCCKEVSVKGSPCIVRVKCHPLVFQMAIEYFYTCDYQFYLDWDFPTRFLVEGQSVPGDGFDRLDCIELSLHLQIHLFAKSLRIPGLKYLSAFKIHQVLSRAAFPTVFPRFVREVYKTITRENAFLRRLLVNHAEKVITEMAGRNHFDGRFPRYIFRDVPDFERDLMVKVGCEEPLDEIYMYEFIAGKLWVC
ncbi:hypothetical protein BDV12DRAFT_205657 [Aspergillus spectabilis]